MERRTFGLERSSSKNRTIAPLTSLIFVTHPHSASAKTAGAAQSDQAPIADIAPKVHMGGHIYACWQSLSIIMVAISHFCSNNGVGAVRLGAFVCFVVRHMIDILLAIGLLFLNGFFVAAEFSLVRVRVSQLEVLRNEGNRSASRVLKVLHEIDSYLSAVQLGITIASLGLGWLAEPAINSHLLTFIQWVGLPIPEDVTPFISFAIAFSFVSFLHIVVGEIAPKSLAIAKPLEVSMFVAMPMRVFHTVFSPVMYLLVAASNGLLRLFKIEPVSGGHSAAISAEELRNIAQHSSNDGTISKSQGTLLENVFYFSTLTAKEVMLSRGKINAIQSDVAKENFLASALDLGHSRYPVYRTNLDDIVGIVHIKDVFVSLQKNDGQTLEDLMRDVVYIPETATVMHVLEKLQQQRSHMAVVVDEYGGTSGILTLEDAIERLVGDIEDEFDPEPQAEFEPQGDGYLVNGETLLDDLTDALGAESIDAESDTVSGFIMEILGRVAKVHDSVEYQDLFYEVVVMKRLRIEKVFVRRTTAQDEPSDDAHRT